MVFYVVSRTYAEIFSLLRVCSGLLSNSSGLAAARAKLIFLREQPDDFFFCGEP